MADHIVVERHARCPRCGHDLRGLVRTWTDACPLEGTCSECGLEFRWPELLSPTVRIPRWCVEFGSRRALPWRAVRTYAMMVVPWIFWRDVRMHQPARLRRVVGLIALTMLLGYVVFCAGHARRAYQLWSGLHEGVTVYVTGDSRMRPARATRNIRVTSAVYATNASPVWVVTQAFLAPWTSTPPGVLVPAPGRSGVFGTRMIDVSLCTLDPAGLPVLPSTLEQPAPAVFMQQYVTSLRSGMQVVDPQFGSGGSSAPHAVLVRLVLIGPLTALLVVPFFALLPQSRMQARVRLHHLRRITLYALVPSLIPFLIAIGGFVPHLDDPRDYAVVVWWAASVAIIAMPAYLFVWWWWAVRRYLRMPHAAAVAGAAVLIAVLVGNGLIWRDLMLAIYFV